MARALKTLATDVCCVQETHIRDSSSTIRLTFPSSPSVKFHLRRSGDPEAAASHVASVGVVLTETVEVALLDWVPVDSWLYALRFRGSSKVSIRSGFIASIQD